MLIYVGFVRRRDGKWVAETFEFAKALPGARELEVVADAQKDAYTVLQAAVLAEIAQQVEDGKLSEAKLTIQFALAWTRDFG